MSLLDHPEAQALLDDATLTPARVRNCADRLIGFLQRYLPKFYRVEQRRNATLVIRGLLSGLERKTCEPIAIQAGLPRKPIQFFVGAGKWDDQAVMSELRTHVRAELAEPEGVVVIDPSGFPKKGTESCGVDRQWCGRLGKVDNCQVGVFLAYAASKDYAQYRSSKEKKTAFAAILGEIANPGIQTGQLFTSPIPSTNGIVMSRDAYERSEA